MLVPETSFNLDVILHAVTKITLRGIPENLLSYPIAVFLVVFIIVFILWRRETISRQARFLSLVWLLAAAAHMFLLVRKLNVHDYYWLPIFPVLALATGVGLEYALRTWRARVPRMLLILFLVSTPLFLRYQFSRQLSSPWVPPEYHQLESLCDKVLPADARIIAAPDPTPSIMLYYAHRKGWALSEDVGTNEVHQAISNGAKYLVSAKSDFWHRSEIERAFPQVLFRQGELAILSTDAEPGS